MRINQLLIPLIKKGANIEAQHFNTGTPLAKLSGNVGTNILLDKGARRDVKFGLDRANLAHRAALNNNFQLLKRVTDKSPAITEINGQPASLLARTNKGESLLHCLAISIGPENLQQVLYEIEYPEKNSPFKNFKLHPVNNKYWTPVHTAVNHGNVEALKLFLDGNDKRKPLGHLV